MSQVEPIETAAEWPLPLKWAAAKWTLIGLIGLLSVVPSTGGAELTRSAGLVQYPAPAGHELGGQFESNPQQLFANNLSQQFQNPPRIRILLTRNVSNAQGSRLSAPEVSYFGALGVGSPPKMFNVVFDTGSGETWLPEYNWFPLANNLHYSDGYSCKDSSSCQRLKKDFKFDYRRTLMEGETYEDLFTLYEDMQKDDAQIIVAPHAVFRQNFLAIDETNDEQFRYKPYDGVVGLAPVVQSGSGTRHILLSFHQELQRHYSAQMEQSPYSGGNYLAGNDQSHYSNYAAQVGAAGYLSNQQQQQQSPHLPELIFSFWFNPNQNSRHGGELMLGGVDDRRFSGDIYFHRINSWFEWQLPIGHVMLGGQLVSCLAGCSAQLDTGANSLVGPRPDVHEIYQILQAQHDRDSDLWLVDCNRLDSYPILVIRIEDTPYTLFPRHYVKLFRFKDSIVCHLAIKPWDNQGWLFGTSFISAYYTVFDFAGRRVGFATPRG